MRKHKIFAFYKSFTPFSLILVGNSQPGNFRWFLPFLQCGSNLITNVR